MNVANRATHLLGWHSDVSRYGNLLRDATGCKDSMVGRICHSQMIVTGFKPKLFVANLLMNFYLKCERFCDAHKVFNGMLERDAVSWNMGLVSFLKDGDLTRARKMFDEMPQRSETVWDAMIGGYLQQGDVMKALGLLPDMLSCGNCISGSFLLQKLASRVVGASASIGDVNSGKALHAHILKLGFPLMLSLGNAVVDMYAKCGEMDFAQKTFDGLPEKDGSTWNSILSGYLRSGRIEEVVLFFASMIHCGRAPNQFSFAMVLSACGSLNALELGKQVHCCVVKAGFDTNPFCEGSLIDMYCKCDIISHARLIFDGILKPDKVSWTAMISGYVQVDCLEEALKLFQSMQESGVKPDQVTFATIINACAVGGMLDDAQRLFYQMSEPNVVIWNVMISGYAQNGHESEALELFEQMNLAGVKPTRSTVGSALSVCANLTYIDLGQQIHSNTIKLGLDNNVYVGSALITMYGRCSSVEDAHKVFDEVDDKSIVLWNSMLGCCLQNDYPAKAVELFCSLINLNLKLDAVTYTCILSACAALSFRNLARQLHTVIIKCNLEQSLFIGNVLIDTYAKLGNLEDASQLFELMMLKDSVSWNSLMAGYAQGSDVDEVVYLFRQMIRLGFHADEVSYACLLSVLADLHALQSGKQVHGSAIKSGFELNVYVGGALVDMYAKCASMEDANKIIAQMPEWNIVSRNALIAGYILNDQTYEAIAVFHQIQAAGLNPNHFTFASISAAFDGQCGLNMGRQVHGYVLKTGFLSDAVLAVALLGMYSRCQDSEGACLLFQELSNRNTVSWTAIISGLVQNNLNEEALDFFVEMRNADVKPDHATFASILKACASLVSLENGKKVHGLTIHTGFDFNAHTNSALVDMYSKCGDISSAMVVFNSMDRHDVISWNAMIVGSSKNGNAEVALSLFKQMLLESVDPDDITFLGVLTACSHSGLVSDGCEYFKSMVEEYGIEPRVDHYACMVDLLGRGGHLNEAHGFVNMLPFKPDSVILASLLASCKVHGNELMGESVAKKLMDVEPRSSFPYVLLSNIHAWCENWEEVRTIRKVMKEKQVKKMPGCSWITVGDRTHSFVSGDKCHPDAQEVYELLNSLTAWIKEDEFVSSYRSFDVE